MLELLDVLDAFSSPLKIAWVVWLAWGVGQIFWYRWERTPRPAVEPAAPRARATRVPASPVAAEAAPVVHRFITPEPVLEVAPPPMSMPSDAVDGPEPPPGAASGWATSEELDRFAADFEIGRVDRRARVHPPDVMDDSSRISAEA